MKAQVVRGSLVFASSVLLTIGAYHYRQTDLPTIDRVAGMSKQTESILKQPTKITADIVEVAAYEEEPELDENEIDLLARLMTAEQGYNATETEYYYTGSVVLNRVNNKRFPNSIYNVIYQNGQYECVSNKHINRPYADVAWEIAEDLLINGSILPENVVFQAEFKQGRGIYAKIGRTYFCY